MANHQTFNKSVNLLSTTYDPTKTTNLQNTQKSENTQQQYNKIKNNNNTNFNDQIQYNKSVNTTTKNSVNSVNSVNNQLPHPARSGTPILNSGLPTHPNHPMNNQTIHKPINTSTSNTSNTSNTANTSNTEKPMSNLLFIDKITDRIYSHFKSKYPTTIESSNFNKSTINTIISKVMNKEPLNEKSINKIIDIIDTRFKMTINSGNRQGEQYNTNSFTMDEESKVDTYLENYTNKITILSDNNNSSNKALEVNLPKQMSPINDLIKLEKSEPFSENFPIRDREKQIDMMKEEEREYIYYIVVNSNDRNIKKFPTPNEFVIDFAPAPASSGDSPPSGYIDRTFHNISKSYLLSVVVLDTSNVSGSSDFGGITFPYLLLQLDELQSNYFGTNIHITKAYAMLIDYVVNGKYKYYNIVGDLSQDTVCKIYNPRINLNKLTIRLLLPNGTPFNFGDSQINDTTNSCITFGISLTTIQKTLSTTFLNSA